MKKHLLLGLTVLSLGATSLPAAANTIIIDDSPKAKANKVAYIVIRKKQRRPVCYDPYAGVYYYCDGPYNNYNSYPYDNYNNGGGVYFNFGGGGRHHHH